jgi:hypothetical protein
MGMAKEIKIRIEKKLLESDGQTTKPDVDWDHHNKEREVFFKYLTRNIF